MNELIIESRMIDSECKAFESEFFMSAINSDIFSIAMEDSQFDIDKNAFIMKASRILKKIFSFIPKLIKKIFEVIKHSKLVTKARANFSLPKDIRELGDQKAGEIKKLRVDILTAKQRIIEAANKKIDKAIDLSEKLYIEMTTVSKQAANSEKKDLMDNNYKMSETKFQKLNDEFTEVVNINIAGSEAVKEYNSKLRALKNLCEDDRLYKISIPTYKGTDKSQLYADKLNQNCTKYLKLAQSIEKSMSRSYDEKRLHFSRSSMAKTEAKVKSNPMNKMVAFYVKCSNHLQAIAKEYATVCNIVYYVPNLPEDGTMVEHHSESANSGKSTRKYDGQLEWSKKEKCWLYTESGLNERGNVLKYVVHMTNYTYKNNRPDPDVNDVRLLRDKIKAEGAKQLFGLDEDAVEELRRRG